MQLQVGGGVLELLAGLAGLKPLFCLPFDKLSIPAEWCLPIMLCAIFRA
jgi:hypothetical protein